MFSLCERCGLNNIDKWKKIVTISRLYHAKVLTKKNRDQVRPVISCRRKEFDFYLGKSYSNLDEIQYASKGWHHRKSKGDFFILHMSDDISMFDGSTFPQTGLNVKLTEILKNQNILQPTEIQSKAIPVIISGKNSLIAAETGCGKTLAYLLPALQSMIYQKQRIHNTVFNSPLCIVLTPSRELAFQIGEVAKSLLKELNMSLNVIVGGGTKRKMLNPTFTETDLLVCTPGAISKLITTGIYKTKQVRHVILDEADTLLDDSFNEKITYILKKIPFSYTSNDNSGVQLTLTSATMPVSLPDVISDIIIPESLVRITTDQLHRILPHVPQRFLRIGRSMKPTQLLLIVKANAAKGYPVMIFSNDSPTCDFVSMFLNENGLNCINLNGNMTLNLRKDRFIKFQEGNVNIISCTDVGSRGLDTTRVKHVINYDFPKYSADYVHRCGRTGRIGSPDRCYVTNFVAGQEEVKLVQKIEIAVRKMESLPNVNGNISEIIQNKIIHKMKN